MPRDDSNERTVLVVDDHAATREALSEFLEAQGFAVRGAADGSAALAALECCRPVLVITDLEMPRMNGRTLIARLRERTEPPLVLVMTANMAVDAEREAHALGAHGFVNKPVDLDVLLARVRGLLRSP